MMAGEPASGGAEGDQGLGEGGFCRWNKREEAGRLSGRSAHNPEDEDAPEFGRTPGSGHILVVPAQVLAAPPAKGHAPRIARKPRMLIRGFTKADGARAGGEGVKIAFDSRGVDENMAVRTAEADKMVGAGDQASARAALKSLCTVSADSAKGEGKDHGLTPIRPSTGENSRSVWNVKWRAGCCPNQFEIQ
jgi:hypothetical protein